MQPNACAIQKIKGDMTPGQQSGANKGGSPRRQNDLPPEIKEIIWPALQVGGLLGKLHFIFIFTRPSPTLIFKEIFLLILQSEFTCTSDWTMMSTNLFLKGCLGSLLEHSLV
jgi:hypothetical protein